MRTLLILLIDFDNAKTLEFTPSAVVTLEMPGNFLYPNPPDAKFNLPIPPTAFDELVVYDKSSHSDGVYVNFSGIESRDMLNVVDPIPNIEYDPSYSLFT